MKIAFVSLCILWTIPTWGDDTPSADEVLENAKLKLSSGFYVLPDETELQKRIREVKPIQRKLHDAVKQQKGHEKQLILANQRLGQMKVTNRNIQNQLRRAANDPATYNQLVQNANQLKHQMEDLTREIEEDQTGTKLRASVSKLRSEFIELILELDKLASKTKSAYEKLASDQEITKAIASANEEAEKAAKIGPSRLFEQNVTLIQKLKGSIVAESIVPRKEKNTLWVTVILNEKYSREMVLDTGADMVCIPESMAREIGLELQDTDQQVQVAIADGSRVRAHLTHLPFVKLGEFTVPNVECVVIPGSKAPPLLGGSFLRNFSINIDHDASKVTLSKVDGEENVPSPPSKKGTPGKKKSAKL